MSWYAWYIGFGIFSVLVVSIVFTIMFGTIIFIYNIVTEIQKDIKKLQRGGPK